MGILNKLFNSGELVKEVGNTIFTLDGEEQHQHIFYSGFQGKSTGNNAYVGAGSVINKNIPNSQTWVGNPGKLLK